MTIITLLYKILNKYIDIPFEIYFKLRKVRSLRKANNLQIEYKKARTNMCRNTFFFGSVHSWNLLPEYIVKSKNLSIFKKYINDYYMNVIYNTLFEDVCRMV